MTSPSMPRIGFLGPRGTFSEIAASRLAASDSELVPFESILKLFDGLISGAIPFIVFPFQNSQAGPVPDSFLSLARHAHTGIHIFQSTVVPVTFSLYRRAADTAPLEEVASHPMGIAQCRRWITSQGLRTKETSSTAGAVEDLLVHRLEGRGALAAPGIATSDEIVEVQKDVQGETTNATRFLLASINSGPAASDGGRLHRVVFFKSGEGLLTSLVDPRSPMYGSGIAKFLSYPAQITPGFEATSHVAVFSLADTHSHFDRFSSQSLDRLGVGDFRFLGGFDV